jgi:hypothetical protein
LYSFGRKRAAYIAYNLITGFSTLIKNQSRKEKKMHACNSSYSNSSILNIRTDGLPLLTAASLAERETLLKANWVEWVSLIEDLLYQDDVALGILRGDVKEDHPLYSERTDADLFVFLHLHVDSSLRRGVREFKAKHGRKGSELFEVLKDQCRPLECKAPINHEAANACSNLTKDAHGNVQTNAPVFTPNKAVTPKSPVVDQNGSTEAGTQLDIRTEHLPKLHVKNWYDWSRSLRVALGPYDHAIAILLGNIKYRDPHYSESLDCEIRTLLISTIGPEFNLLVRKSESRRDHQKGSQLYAILQHGLTLRENAINHFLALSRKNKEGLVALRELCEKKYIDLLDCGFALTERDMVDLFCQGLHDGGTHWTNDSLHLTTSWKNRAQALLRKNCNLGMKGLCQALLDQDKEATCWEPGFHSWWSSYVS